MMGRPQNSMVTSCWTSSLFALLRGSFLFVQAVSNGSGCRFVDDSEDVEASNHAGIFGRLSLGIVEISRDCDDGVGDFSTEIALSSLLYLRQNHRRNFFRVELLLLSLVLKLSLGF